MSKYNVIGAWETPRNEGTAVFRVGKESYYATCPDRYSDRWKVGMIRTVGNEDDGLWVQVYDTNGDLKITMPHQTVAIEFGDYEQLLEPKKG